MPGKTGLDGDFGRFGIADFTDHNDVGVLAQNRAETPAKVRSILGLTWIWPIPLIWYSIGSSMVMMFFSLELTLFSAA